MAARALATLALLAALSVTGCGGDGNAERDVRRSVRAFVTELRNRDYEAACYRYVAYQLRAQVMRAGTCTKGFRSIVGRKPWAAYDLRVVSVNVNGDSAQARLRRPTDAARATLRVVKEDGEWRISALR
jgi:hypothetical protein